MDSGSATAPRRLAPVIAEALRRGLPGPRPRGSSDARLHAGTTVDTLLDAFVLASIPAFLMGAWAWGAAATTRLAANPEAALSGWFAFVLGMADSTGPSVLSATLVGIALFLPQLIVALTVSLLFEVAFAAARKRPVDAGWFMTGWLYALLLPPIDAPFLTALSLGFGVVFGKHIFGGTGRYIVNPALLGVIFFELSFPGVFASDAASGIFASTWSVVAAQGSAALDELQWTSVFLGGQVGAFGSSSLAACLAGAAYLMFRGAASLRIVGGGVAGTALTAILIGAMGNPEAALLLPPEWHLALGNLGFALAFIATDPTTTPATRAGRWAFGIFAGTLTVVVRTLDPEHVDGTLTAILLASLCIPLFDHIAVRIHIRRWQKKELWP